MQALRRCFILVFLCVFASPLTAAPLAQTAPSTIGMDAEVLVRIDRIVEKNLAAKNMPGCVVCIGRHGKIGFLKSYGNKKVPTEKDPRELPATTDTVYDLASLTKSIATATSIMILAERGKIDIEAPVSRYLPEFRTPTKETVTVRQLLLHTAGFIPDNDLTDYQDGLEKSVERLLALEPIHEPGFCFNYSDVSFQLLGILVERISGLPLDEFARKNIFQPLGMKETDFVPKGRLAERAAPTVNRELGEVHDPRAFKMDGVAGHAGLFSTANDLAVFAAALLGEGQMPGRSRILKPESVRLMRKPNVTSAGYRGLGWDMQSTFSGNRGKTMSPQAFGHGGFTGTALWIDPAFDLFVVFLSNRVHPDGEGSVNMLAGEIGTIAVDAVLDLPLETTGIVEKVRKNITDMQKKCRFLHDADDSDNVSKTKSTVLAGIDVLRRNDFSVLKGKRVGLITNPTGLDGEGKTVAVLLREAVGVELVALFSPEHGFAGRLEEDDIPDEQDSVTELKIYSLYGKHRKPTPQMLDGIDVLVFDIQDIGTRFYTYIGTMLGAMEAAAMKNISFVVLDRPNPIGGEIVEGPMFDPGLERLAACFRMPIRHGMTVGELALMMNLQRRLGLDLCVVPCCGWTRNRNFDENNMKWINPSPNMRSLSEAFLYPGVGLLEFTNLSVGRGTATPFELIGAPWIDENRFAEALHKAAGDADLTGVAFEPIRFTPDASQYKEESCGGVRLVLKDTRKLNAVRLGMILSTTLRSLYEDDWNVENLNALLLCRKTCDMILAKRSVIEIESAWEKDREYFISARKYFLLYD